MLSYVFSLIVFAIAMSICGCASVPHQVKSSSQVTALITNVFSTDYAPKEFKERNSKWNLEAATDLLQRHLESSGTGPRSAFLEFFGSLKDLHSRPVFQKQNTVWLGFHVKRVGERYLIAWVDPVSPAKRLISVGDEIRQFDQKSVSQAIGEIQRQTRWFSTPAFEQSFAEWFLTFRSTSDFSEVPAVGRDVEIEIVKPGGNSGNRIVLQWINENEHPASERCPYWGKSKIGFLPALGSVVWKSPEGSVYSSYIFRHGGKDYGYIRFQTYDLSSQRRLQALSELDNTVSELNKRKVSSIVIDQTGNGGGNFVFGFALLSRLTDKKMRTPLQRYIIDGRKLVGFGDIKAIEEDIQQFAKVKTDAEASEMLARHPLFTDNLNFIRKDLASAKMFFNFMNYFVEEAKLNPSRHLTKPWHQVQEWIEPHPKVHYGGSIILLIDELNLSAAEFIASTLQDNHRAKLIGVTTAGAGGDQRAITMNLTCPNPSGVYQFNRCISPEDASSLKSMNLQGFTYTITLGERVSRDGKMKGPIENVGVFPDIPHALTERDIRANFRDYRKLILNSL